MAEDRSALTQPDTWPASRLPTWRHRLPRVRQPVDPAPRQRDRRPGCWNAGRSWLRSRSRRPIGSGILACQSDADARVKTYADPRPPFGKSASSCAATAERLSRSERAGSRSRGIGPSRPGARRHPPARRLPRPRPPAAARPPSRRSRSPRPRAACAMRGAEDVDHLDRAAGRSLRCGRAEVRDAGEAVDRASRVGRSGSPRNPNRISERVTPKLGRVGSGEAPTTAQTRNSVRMRAATAGSLQRSASRVIGTWPAPGALP